MIRSDDDGLPARTTSHESNDPMRTGWQATSRGVVVLFAPSAWRDEHAHESGDGYPRGSFRFDSVSLSREKRGAGAGPAWCIQRPRTPCCDVWEQTGRVERGNPSACIAGGCVPLNGGRRVEFATPPQITERGRVSRGIWNRRASFFTTQDNRLRAKRRGWGVEPAMFTGSSKTWGLTLSHAGPSCTECTRAKLLPRGSCTRPVRNGETEAVKALRRLRGGRSLRLERFQCLGVVLRPSHHGKRVAAPERWPGD